jgi:DNA-directed RNA polymerase subunit RPC12/RpoP
MPRNGHKNCEDACVIEGGIPAIIDMDTWKKACACMDKHRRAPGSVRAKVEYLLSDLISCGECHQKMQGNSYRHQLKNKVKEYLYYRCPNCGRQIKGRPLEKQVIDVIRHSILNNRHIRSIVDSINVKLEESNMEFTAEIHSLQSQISTLEQSNDRLMGLLETGEISDLLIARIKKNSEKAAAARQRLAEIKEYSREVLSVEKVKAVINNWKMTNNEEGYKAMINTFVRSVTVYKDNIDVDLYLCIGSNEYTSEKLKKSLAK